MTQLADFTFTDELYWADEYQWAPAEQSSERTLNGRMIVEENERIAGRPITLRGLWLTRTEVQTLRALEAQLGTEMTLTLPDGRTFTVLFRREDAPAVSAEAVYPAPDPAGDDFYEVTIRLMEA